MRKVMRVMMSLGVLWTGSQTGLAQTNDVGLPTVPVRDNTSLYQMETLDAHQFFRTKPDVYVSIGTNALGKVVVNEPDNMVTTCQIIKTLNELPEQAAYAYKMTFYQDNTSGGMFCVANQVVAPDEETLLSYLVASADDPAMILPSDVAFADGTPANTHSDQATRVAPGESGRVRSDTTHEPAIASLAPTAPATAAETGDALPGDAVVDSAEAETSPRLSFDQGKEEILSWLEAETGGQFVELTPEEYQEQAIELKAIADEAARRQAMLDNDRDAFDSPVDSQGYVSFGYRQPGYDFLDGIHRGIDYGHPEREQAIIRSVATGRILDVRDSGDSGYGQHVIAEYEYNGEVYRVYYAHLSEIFVYPNQEILRGESIGKMGTTGLSTGTHLHFEVRIPPYEGTNDIDPWGVSKH